MSPFGAKAEMRIHNPKDKGERTSISLDVRSTSFEAQPSFGQMPLFHTAIRLTLQSLSNGIIVSPCHSSCSTHDQQWWSFRVPRSRSRCDDLDLGTERQDFWGLSEVSLRMGGAINEAAAAAAVFKGKRCKSKELVVFVQEEKLDRTEEFLRAVVFRPSTQRLNVVMDSLSVGLVDDRYGHHIKVLAARLQVPALKPLSPTPSPSSL